MSRSSGTSTTAGDAAARTPATGREQAEREAEFRMASARLQAEGKRIQEEISSYPAPIAGCDEQFNYLLERRAQVRRALALLLEEEKTLCQRSQRSETV